MNLDDPPRRRHGEPFVPMINVVFLLLIFFLMTAQIAPPEPFELEPPKMAQGGDPTSETVLHLSTEGKFAYREMRGEDAVRAALAEGGGGTVKLRADKGMEASILAGRLKMLAADGVTAVELITTPK